MEENVNIVAASEISQHRLTFQKQFVHRILTKCLKMYRVCFISVWHILIYEHLNSQVAVCKGWLEMIENNPNIFKKVVMCNESSMHHFEPTLRQQSATWKTKKVWQTQSAGKVMLIACFDFVECFSSVMCPPPKMMVNSKN